MVLFGRKPVLSQPMSESLFLVNLTSPPLLFFMLGAAAALLRSDLEIPEQVAKLLSLYLLMAIGFKGGVALATTPLSATMVTGLGIAVFLSCLVPVYTFFILKQKLPPAEAAAVAATYGSISAVTFVTATNYLANTGVEWNGYLVAAMALMESPAIIIGLLLYRFFASEDSETVQIGELLKEAFLNGSVFLILGSLVVGWISGPAGKEQLSLFVDGLFTGILCLFLLDMGIVAMHRLSDIGRAAVSPALLVTLGLLLPLVNAALALGLVITVGLPEGDALLIVVLAASASYIAVPAAMRLSLPEANPSVYLGMSLAVTFPFNLIVGIPLYHELIELLS